MNGEMQGKSECLNSGDAGCRLRKQRGVPLLLHTMRDVIAYLDIMEVDVPAWAQRLASCGMHPLGLGLLR